jgi:DNA-binding MarR family transcriptional regulator
VDALDLIMLGRQLSRIGTAVLQGRPLDEPAGQPTGPAGAGPGRMAAGAQLVLRDVLAHPGSSIRDITTRTGLPQSYVSQTVARLGAAGMTQTSSDPADGRRTLVRVSGAHLERVARQSARGADAVLLAALGDIDDAQAREVLRVLADLAGRLRSRPPGPLLDRIQEARSGSGTAGD